MDLGGIRLTLSAVGLFQALQLVVLLATCAVEPHLSNNSCSENVASWRVTLLISLHIAIDLRCHANKTVFVLLIS